MTAPTGGPVTRPTPHLEKIRAAQKNPVSHADLPMLAEIETAYNAWISSTQALKSAGQQRVKEMVALLNTYKDRVEFDLILSKASPEFHRQKGQLKIESSIMEEFLVLLMDGNVLPAAQKVRFLTGPQDAFMGLSFQVSRFDALNEKPMVILKTKDQDFIIGTQIHYQFSADAAFPEKFTARGKLNLAVFATECKVNYDKTMFQECAGTALRLKEGVPFAKYFVLVEWLDMTPEDPRLTEIDNVFLLRKAKRLPADKRKDKKAVAAHRKGHPIDAEVIWRFVREIDSFIQTQWYNPDAAVARGSFL